MREEMHGTCRQSKRGAHAAIAAAGLLALSCLAAPAAAQVLPSPWRSTDIGNLAAAGSATENAGTFTIQASGSDIWGTSDQFHFLYQEFTGDVDVIARIDSILKVHQWSKAGVMIRSSLAPGASHGFALVSGGKGIAFQRRRLDGGNSYSSSGGSLNAPPQWMRIVRQGPQVTAYASADGVRWTTVGTDTIALGSAVYVGIAVTSHASGLTTAVASQVAVYPLSLPDGYATSDVGGPTPVGGASHRAGVFTVGGAGADIYGTHDEFRYVYQQVSGDVDIRARVTAVQYQNRWTKAGVMVRETLTDDSRQGFALVSAGRGYAFQRRAETGGLSASTAGGFGVAPGWVRIVRTGTEIDAYRSPDGTNWTLMGSDTIAMGTNVYVGLVVSSHVPGVIATATFDNVSITTQGSGNAAPTVSLTAPASGATFAAPASTTVSATAGDSDGQIARVDFLANNSLIGTASTAPYSINWSGVQSGTYSVSAIAYDDGGANTESAPVTVTVTPAVDQPPTVALTAPASGASYTAPATVTVSATASDPENALVRVDFYANGTQIGSATTAPYAITWPNVAAGSYALTAIARDAVSATTSAAVDISVAPAPNQPPTVALTAPASGAIFTAPASITVSASASDPEGALSGVDFYANGTQIGTDATAPYSIAWSSVPAGSYSLTAIARDAAGRSTTSAAIGITVAAVSASWQVAFTASADHATVTRYVLEVFSAGADPATAVPIANSDLGKPTPSTNGDIVVDRTTFFDALAAGNYIATVRAENTAGANRSSPVSFTR